VVVIVLGITGSGTLDVLAIEADWLIRILTPAAVAAVGMPELLPGLETLPPITEQQLRDKDTAQCERVTRRAQLAVLARHRQIIDVVGSDQCRSTDEQLLAWMTTPAAAVDICDSLNQIIGGRFPGPATRWAYSTVLRCIAMLHLWGQRDQADVLAETYRRTHNDCVTRIFLECDVQMISKEVEDR